MAKKVILDVDTGSDDAVALMLALLSEDIDVVGITVVNGNRNVNITTNNTLRVVEYLGFNTPVYKGCHLPIASTLLKGRRENVPYCGPENAEEDVHGDYLPLPEPKMKAQAEHAVFWLVNTLMNTEEPLTLICVGPLTNLAMALRLEPQIAEHIDEIIIMGGGYLVNNITSGAEFNFWIDPEAAKIVLDSGAPIRLVPLDATHAAYISLEESNQIKEINTPAALFCADVMQQRIKGYAEFQPMPVPMTTPVHDALAVCALIEPDVLTSIMNVNVDISISPGITDGMSLCDVEGRDRERKPNACVAKGADREKFIALMKRILETPTTK